MKIYLKLWLTISVLTLVTLVMLTLAHQPIQAAGPWYVAPDGDDGNLCTSSGAACATINGALAKPGFTIGDTILVASGTYTNAGGNEVVLLDKDVTLSGGWDASFTTQSGTSIIDGEGARRGITVNNGVTASIERFTVQNGSADRGGGVYNYGNLILNNSTVSNNTASYRGGGIYNYEGAITLNGSTTDNNMADEDGGGIYNFNGFLMLDNSIVNHNMANIYGGGILNEGAASLTLTNSTISRNIAVNGAGLFNQADAVILTNSTVSGNTAIHSGGGIQNESAIILSNSTVSNNTANVWAGGIYNSSILNSVKVILQNTILAGNTSFESPDCFGKNIESAGYNLIGNVTGCTFAPTDGDLTDTDAKLGPLEGSPGYHPLLLGSPAIDAGNPAGCSDPLGSPLPFDQRGMPRMGRCDMGAYEFGLSAAKQAVGAYTPGAPLSYVITLDNDANTDITGIHITDTLPISLTYVTGSFSATNGAGGESDGVITWSGAVPAGGGSVISFRTTVDDEAPSCSFITNKVLINDGADHGFEREVTGITPCLCNLTKHAGNPVLSTGADGSWDSRNVWKGTVLKEDGVYKMWYIGDNGSAPPQIGLATSTDGIDWRKDAANPVLSPSESWEVGGVKTGSVIFDDGLYKMWYTGVDSNGVGRIGYATSPNGIVWTKDRENPVMDAGDPGSWEDEGVMDPSVIRDGRTYHMWYTGYDGVTVRIGHAVSTDGILWTKELTASPVLDIGPPGEWDWLEVYGPSVVKVGSEYQLWYSGATLPQAWQTGYALSSNGKEWTRKTMLIPEGGSGAFDANSADYASVMVEETGFKVWYSGLNDNGAYNIGYATAEFCGEVSPAPVVSRIQLPIVLKNASPQYPCSAYYIDDFSDPDSGWPIGEDDNRKYAYTDGQYQIWVKNPSQGWLVTPGAKATNFTVAVSARRTSGDHGVYGIVFGLNEDWSEYYEVLIDANYYSIWWYDGNLTALQNWTSSEHIRTDTNWNRLKVIRDGNNIVFYVNDHYLTMVTDGRFTGLGRIGLMAFSPNSGPLDARFDDFALYPANCSASASAATVGFDMGKPESHKAPIPPGVNQFP